MKQDDRFTIMDHFCRNFFVQRLLHWQSTGLTCKYCSNTLRIACHDQLVTERLHHSHSHLQKQGTSRVRVTVRDLE